MFHHLKCEDLLLSFSFMAVNEESLCSVLLAGQKKQFKDVIYQLIGIKQINGLM